MLDRLYDWYGKRVVRGAVIALVLLIIVGIFVHIGTPDDSALMESEKKIPVVNLQRVGNFVSQSSFSVVGTVSAVSEAKLQTETSGMVTEVKVTPGDVVTAGTVLASIENSAERAQLLQAEGAYEAARAASEQSTVTLDEARIGIRNTYRDTLVVAENTVRNLIDDFYSNPGLTTSGFKLGGTGRADEFNARRFEIEIFLDTWSKQVSDEFANVSEETMLQEAENTLTKISSLAADIAVVLNDDDSIDNFTDDEVAVYIANINGARTSLGGALASLSGARSGYEQSRIAGGNGASLASAQLKSAFGALRAAQSRYEKTLIRTPIGGVVNTLYLKKGEYVGMNVPAAIVANNGSLEIKTALGEKDFAGVFVGDMVSIDNIVKGTVTSVAPAIDPITGKSEVKIAVEKQDALKNGSTVSITFTRATREENDNAPIIVPLRSLKMLASGSVAFGVNEESKLISYPVTLGSVTGDSVIITEGLTKDALIVTDARGLKEGDTVSVIKD